MRSRNGHGARATHVLDSGQLVMTRTTRLNAIAPYYTMFPLEFPLEALAKAPAGTWVLDPFCGRGTTLFAARLLGLPSVGIDVSPVAYALAAAKLSAASPDDVVQRADEILASQSDVDLPTGEFWDLAYDPSTLRQLALLRASLVHAEDDVSVLLRALVLGILHGPLNKGVPSYASNQMPRTYATKPAGAIRYWRANGLGPPRVNVLDVLRRRVAWVLAATPAPSQGFAIHGDCRQVLPTLPVRFSWVVTSPPYLGMRTYVPDQWLRFWFLGGPSRVSYSAEGQVGRWTSGRFADELAEAWRTVAGSCADGAVLVVRFGALPSKRTDPRDVLQSSLVASGMPWRVLGSEPSGLAPRQARQAAQFARVGRAVEEIDLVARLD